MQSNNYEWFISQIVESMLPTFTHKDVVLGMILSSSYGVFYKDEEYRECENFFVLFHRPSNYTKVLMKKINHLERPLGVTHLMEQLSDHDSCWRSDGLRWIFKSWMDMRDKIETAGVPSKYIREHEHWSFHFDLFQGSPKYYLTEIFKRNDEDPNRRYKSPYLVKLKEEIPLSEIHKYLPKQEV